MPASPVKVLIISEEPDIRIYLVNLLQTNGYQVMAAAGMEEGVGLIHTQSPSLVVLDTMLPGDQAQRIYMALRTQERSLGIPVVLLSPLSRRTLRGSRFYSAGVSHKRLGEPEAFLNKPPEAEDFLAAVRRLTGNVDTSDLNERP